GGCALYLRAAGGEAPAEASKAFALGYGHVPLFGPARLHEPIEEYGRWLEARRLAHTPERLRAWVEREYRSDEPPAPFRPLRPGPREPLVSWQAPAGGGPNPREPPATARPAPSRTPPPHPTPPPPA